MRRVLPLIALFLATVGIATTEFAVVDLLPDIASDLNVTIPKAGLLVSDYALGVALGGPILTILASRLTRKSALLALMGLFVIGHILSALAAVALQQLSFVWIVFVHLRLLRRSCARWSNS